MASRQTVFLVGAGYIGQNVLNRLLEAKYPVTVLVRRPEQALRFEKIGVKTVLGSLTDLELITSQTAQHEITINTASCMDLPSVQAILSGIRQRVQTDQPCSIYLHTSSTGILQDNAMGMYKNQRIYHDDNPGVIDAIPHNFIPRNVDIPIVEAAREEFRDKAKLALVLPPFVYGLDDSDPPLRRHTHGLDILVRFALSHGFTGYVGEGRNEWSLVHVKDLGNVYMSLLDYIIKDSSFSSAALRENPYFFVEDGSTTSMRDMAEHISRILYDLGKIPSPKVQSFSDADYDDVWGPVMTPVAFGTNSRIRAVRLRELGWEPREKDFWTSMKEEEIQSMVAALESV